MLKINLSVFFQILDNVDLVIFEFLMHKTMSSTFILHLGLVKIFIEAFGPSGHLWTFSYLIILYVDL